MTLRSLGHALVQAAWKLPGLRAVFAPLLLPPFATQEEANLEPIDGIGVAAVDADEVDEFLERTSDDEDDNGASESKRKEQEDGMGKRRRAAAARARRSTGGEGVLGTDPDVGFMVTLLNTPLCRQLLILSGLPRSGRACNAALAWPAVAQAASRCFDACVDSSHLLAAIGSSLGLASGSAAAIGGADPDHVMRQLRASATLAAAGAGVGLGAGARGGAAAVGATNGTDARSYSEQMRFSAAGDALQKRLVLLDSADDETQGGVLEKDLSDWLMLLNQRAASASSSMAQAGGAGPPVTQARVRLAKLALQTRKPDVLATRKLHLLQGLAGTMVVHSSEFVDVMRALDPVSGMGLCGGVIVCFGCTHTCPPPLSLSYLQGSVQLAWQLCARLPT